MSYMSIVTYRLHNGLNEKQTIGLHSIQMSLPGKCLRPQSEPKTEFHSLFLQRYSKCLRALATGQRNISTHVWRVKQALIGLTAGEVDYSQMAASLGSPPTPQHG